MEVKYQCMEIKYQRVLASMAASDSPPLGVQRNGIGSTTDDVASGLQRAPFEIYCLAMIRVSRQYRVFLPVVCS